jgi:hypothetical protein
MKVKINKARPWIALITAIILLFLCGASIRAHFIPKKPEIRLLKDSWMELKMAINSYQTEAIRNEAHSPDPVSRKKAIDSSKSENPGHWPPSLEMLVPQYINAIPCDPDGNQKVVSVYDGTGGWVYNNQTGEFMPNVPLSPLWVGIFKNMQRL